MSDSLILRTSISPYGDTTKGSVLSAQELDGNLITLKGGQVSSMSLTNNVLMLNQLNGNVLDINLSSIVADSKSGINGMVFDNSNYNLSIYRNDGVTFTQSLAILATDMTITGGTFDSGTGTATFTNNKGGSFQVTGFVTGYTDTHITGVTFDNSNYILTLGDNAGEIFNTNLSILATDITVTGGTYNTTTGIVTFTNNKNGSFQVSGFTVGYTDLYVSGGTFSNDTLYLNRTDGVNEQVTGLSENILYNTKIPSGTTVGYSVGGISGGTLVNSLTGQTIINILDNILFPTINPNVQTNPSSSLGVTVTPSAGGQYLYLLSNNTYLFLVSGATTFNIYLTDSYNAGSVYLNGTLQGAAGGNANVYTFYVPNSTSPVTIGSSNYNYILTPTIGQLTSFGVTTTYDVGPSYKDSRGNNVGSLVPAGKTPKASSNVEGVYPLYATVYNGNISAISAFTQLPLLSMVNPPSTQPNGTQSTNGAFAISFASEVNPNGGAWLGYKQKIIIPTGITKTLNIIKYTNNVGNNETNSWPRTTITYNGLGYYQYVYNGSNRGATNGGNQTYIYFT